MLASIVGTNREIPLCLAVLMGFLRRVPGLSSLGAGSCSLGGCCFGGDKRLELDELGGRAARGDLGGDMTSGSKDMSSLFSRVCSS